MEWTGRLTSARPTSTNVRPASVMRSKRAGSAKDGGAVISM